MRIDDYETFGHVFDGDKFFFIKKRKFKDTETEESFSALILDVWHSSKKYQPGEEKHDEARALNLTRPAFAMIFKHRKSIEVMHEIFGSMLEKFDQHMKEKENENQSNAVEENT
jgi:hypothetical protein